jgi:uncharacterized protein
MFDRWYAHSLQEKLKRPFVHLMFGARQTGKSTLLNALLPDNALRIDLSHPGLRSQYLANPDNLIKQCLVLPKDRKSQYVFVDEVQSVPEIFDAVQHLYDSDKKRWRFILCGSSARKLRQSGSNLLPGRSFYHRLYPLLLTEHPSPFEINSHEVSPLPVKWKKPPFNLFPAWKLEKRLAYGALPGIVTCAEKDRADLLQSYAIIHLEEEIRRESFVKDWGAFVRFLQLAAAESGKVLNYSSISQESGISQPTIKNYYQLLEDMFIGFRVPAFSKSPRKNLLSTPKFLFFDIGVRHAAAGLNPSIEITKVDPGMFFEQWVGIELWKRVQYLGNGSLYYQRTRDGAEIDFIVKHHEQLIPIEVKWTTNPTISDARHLRSFLIEHPKQSEKGYIVCRCSYPMEIEKNIIALPWQNL